jgi:hypothetical protein
MPNFDYFDGIKINIYYDEHLPPHIHAEYGDDEVLLVIETGEIYEGWLPVKQLKKSRRWLVVNKSNALVAFNALNPHLYAPRKKKTKNIKSKKR